MLEAGFLEEQLKAIAGVVKSVLDQSLRELRKGDPAERRDTTSDEASASQSQDGPGESGRDRGRGRWTTRLPHCGGAGQPGSSVGPGCGDSEAGGQVLEVVTHGIGAQGFTQTSIWEAGPRQPGGCWVGILGMVGIGE